MSQAIGTMYKIAKVPIRLYYDSDRAAKRNTTQAGWVQEAGDYRIVNVRWTNANGDWLQTKPTSGGIAIYAIKDITDSYTIGWVRDDDNITKGVITSVPNSISTEDESFKVVFTKMPGSTYTLKFSTNNTEWLSYTSSDNSIGWSNPTFVATLYSKERSKLYNAMSNLVSSSVTVTLETFYEGKSLGTDTKTIQVSIPSSIKPSFASTPAATITGAVGGKNYVGLTSLKVTVPTINIPSGAKITSTIIDIGGQRSGNLAVGGSFTRTFNSSGTIPVSVTTTDSRGRSAVYSTTYTVLEAKNISIDSFTAIRNGKTGIKITANGQYMSQIDGTPKYTITKSVRGKNSWSSVATGNVTVSNGRYSIAVTQTSGFTATSAYDLRLVVSGTSTSATGTSVVGTEAVPISFGKHGSGVGTMFNNSNSASLQVGSGGIDSEGPITINGNTLWSASNDGSGSGLDADLLDGLHASSFARSTNLPSHGVSDGAQYSQYTKINDFYFSRGSASFTDVSQGVITFPVTYANPPYVLISIEANHRYLNISAHIQTNSTKNVTVVFGYNNGATSNFFHIIPGTINIHWQAIGQVW